MEELEIIKFDPEVALVLEACRLLSAGTRMSATSRRTSRRIRHAGITLDGYLLMPIQRICRYPLLLQEVN